MNYATVCSGVEAPSVAWHPLGWNPIFFSEISPFPSSLLSYHYPDVVNLGDMSKINATKFHGKVDVFCGGTPCQSFSVAGLRRGLNDPRGGLLYQYIRIISEMLPRWVIWENVPGVMQSNGGKDFGTLLGGLAELGYGFAYRVFDAQYFGVPQRRRRVFVIGYFGDWKPPASVLFDGEGMPGDFAPRGKQEKDFAAFVEGSFGAYREADIGATLKAAGGCLSGGSETFIVSNGEIRRLTPVECERLQGFPDDYTNIPYRGRNGSPDALRYRALGNSMAVPVMKCIGERIHFFDKFFS